MEQNMTWARRTSIAVVLALLAIPLLEGARAQGNGQTSWPDAWTSQDVGDVGAAGSSELVGTRLIVRGSGADVWGTADAFHFAHTSISGDFELTAYVSHVDDLDRWTKAGLMVRDGVAANARHVFLLATPRTARGVAFQRRPITDGSSVHTAGPATAPPVWLQLTRRGDFVTAAVRTSEIGAWTQIGEQRFSGLPHAVNVGFAVSSHVDGSQAEAWFEQIALKSLDQIPATWTSSDVGDVGAAGHSFVDEDSGPEFTVTGSGADLWGTADEFHFLSREVTGNFDFSARIAAVDNLDKWTKAGLMMRDGLSADARHAFVLQTPRTERGVAFQRRPLAGGGSVHTAGPGTAPPGFLRLVRDGDVVSAYHRVAPDDLWVRIGTPTFTSLPGTVQIGFAVSSHVDGSLATAYFDNFELTLGSPHWVGTDIGGVGAAGHSSVDEDSGPEFTVTGSGADVWGTADELHFLSREVVGNSILPRAWRS
jgi:regulation of enolase protein 1 (concanavalin A-like superfamily)